MKGYKAPGLLLGLCCLSLAQQVDYNVQVQFPPGYLSDQQRQPFATFYAACAKAVSTGQILAVTRNWTSVSTGTCAAKLSSNGGVIRPASGQTVTLTGTLTGPLSRIFDVSASGSHIHFGPGLTTTAYPEWAGAVSDGGSGSTDSTAAIQAMIDASCYSGACFNSITFTGQYSTTAQINGYSTGQYNNLRFIAGQSGLSGIYYRGPGNTAALRTIGQFTNLGAIKIQSMLSTGWTAGWIYDGQAGIGSSTGGYAEQLVIECAGHVGRGIWTGPSGLQADQFLLDKPYIVDCYYGNGVDIADPNSLTNVIVGGTIGHCHAAVKNTVNSNNVIVVGTEFDDNDINVWPALGGSYYYTGVRSEGSRRQIWTGAGSAPQPVTLDAWLTAAYNDVRPTTTGAGTATTTSLTLSCPSYTTGGPCFTEGDWINIAGAGPAGGNLNVAITSLSGATLNIASLSGAISTTVTTAAVTLDKTTAHFIQFYENSGGPYIHRGGHFLDSFISGASGQVALASAGNAQTFTENTWGGYGTLVNGPFASGSLPSSSVVFGNTIDADANAGGPYYPNSAGGMAQQFLPNTLVSTPLTSFTPVLKFCSGSIPSTCVAPTGITYTTQSAWYRTLNGQTTAYIYVTLSALGTGPGSGDVAVITGSGLPSGGTSGGGGAFIGAPSTFSAVTLPFGVQILPGAAYVSLYYNSEGALLTFNKFSDTSAFVITVTYD